MASETEADSECASRTDANQMKDSVRRRRPGILERLLRVFPDIADSADHVDGDEVAVPPRLELSFVSLFVNLLTGVSDLLR